MKRTAIVFMILLCFRVLVLAAEHSAHGEAHDEQAIPFQTIGYQAINLGILLVGLFFAVRKSVAIMFKERYENYTDQAKKTAEATQAAEVALTDIKNRINQLQSSEASSMANAKNEAEVIKKKIIQEAEAQAEKIKSDTKLIINTELNNARNEIRNEIINASIEVAKINIKNSAERITKKSEQGFLSDIAKTKNTLGSSVLL